MEWLWHPKKSWNPMQCPFILVRGSFILHWKGSAWCFITINGWWSLIQKRVPQSIFYDSCPSDVSGHLMTYWTIMMSDLHTSTILWPNWQAMVVYLKSLSLNIPCVCCLVLILFYDFVWFLLNFLLLCNCYWTWPLVHVCLCYSAERLRVGKTNWRVEIYLKKSLSVILIPCTL